MSSLTNFDLFSVGLTVAAIGILGFTVVLNNIRSATNRTFLLFSLITVFWGIVNYLSYRVGSPSLTLWLLRLVIASAVWHAFSFFQLFYVFPDQKIKFPKWYKFALLPVVALSSIVNLTPLSFTHITKLSSVGSVSTVGKGPGMGLFVAVVIFLIVGGFVLLIKKFRKSTGLERTQFKYILAGTLITFSLIFTFNFFLPAAFDIVRLIPLGATFIFPFIAFTAYAIFKHHLLNVKVIATEILTFILAVVTLLEVILSNDLPILIFRGSIFLLVLSFGILLIKSVLKEVEQREQLQILTTKLKEANQKLKLLDQARADFITMASHQLRTPPSTLKWYLAAILAGDFGQPSPEIKTALGKMQLSNNAMISLIDDMLNASRIERGKIEFNFEVTDLLEITRFTVDQLRPLAETKQLKLVFNPSKSKLPPIMSDKEKLRQVINNLIDNAIKYTKTGQITVALSKTAKEVVLAVSDTGKGMTREDLDTLFQKYGRQKDSSKYSAGLGLGLFLAKVIVNQHAGKIWAESEGVGHGSTFIISLPVKSGIKATATFDLAKNK